MPAYYNEHDSEAAAWLRELIKGGHIASGDVDERSIADVQTGDIKGYDQAHFFAGIGGWSYALRLAGWGDDRPVWTGSCPCQPFSVAGKHKGTADERHLWPEMFRLIRECKPATVFGEQVAGSAGRAWLSSLFADLEGAGYATAGANLCAAGVGAPHVRQRLYWVADAHGERRQGLEPRQDSGRYVQSDWSCEANMQHVARSPFTGNDCRPKSLLCQMDDGIPGRLAILRGYGNALVPQVAAEFVSAYCEGAESV
jgi:DNA (cytosine-5)-methyltransferase 1